MLHLWHNEPEGTTVYSGERTPTRDDLEELVSASTPGKLRRFRDAWLPFTSWEGKREEPFLGYDLLSVSDTRTLMLIVLELKRMVDENDCTKEAYERLGLLFGTDSRASQQTAHLRYLMSSHSLAWYLRSINSCEWHEANSLSNFLMDEETRAGSIRQGYIDEEDRLVAPIVCVSYLPGRIIQENGYHLPGQEEEVSRLEPSGTYPVFSASANCPDGSDPYSHELAYGLMDDIFATTLGGVSVDTYRGQLTAMADTVFTYFWLCLSESFRDARVGICRTCGLPIIVSGERGAKRLYCNDGCKRKYKRAQRFARLVNEQDMDYVAATKDAGIAAATAIRIMERNGITVTPPKGA